MPDRTNLTYIYDGSFEGLLTLIFDCFADKSFPIMITDDTEAVLLTECRRVVTDPEKAERVRRGVSGKMTHEALQLINTVHFSAAEDKELLTLEFVRKGMKLGRHYADMLTDITAAAMMKAARAVGSESRRYIQFIRFSDCGGVLVAVISPINYVLPFIEPHFTDRYTSERLLIYDKTHKSALIYDGENSVIVPLEEFTPPAAGENEKLHRDLWRMFYDTVAIESRKNERCRMNHMPKRYWSGLTEFTPFETERALKASKNPALSEKKLLE